MFICCVKNYHAPQAIINNFIPSIIPSLPSTFGGDCLVIVLQMMCSHPSTSEASIIHMQIILYGIYHRLEPSYVLIYMLILKNVPFTASILSIINFFLKSHLLMVVLQYQEM